MPSIQYTPNSGFFGADSFTYRVTNPDGGTDTAIVNVTVNDTEAPVAIISAPTAGFEFALGTTSASITGTATDNDSVALVEYRLNGGAWQAATGTSSWSGSVTGLTDGSGYTVDVRAQDPSGNLSPVVSRSFSVASDGSAPTIAITDPSGELAAGTTSYTVQGTAADNDSVALVEYRLDGGAWQTATGTTAWTATLTGLTDGASVNFEARATDGNSNESSIAQRTITVNHAPTANADNVTTDLDTPVTHDVLANDLNVDAGATLTIEVDATFGTAVVVP